MDYVENYTRLANEIILLAVADYRKAARQIKKKVQCEEAKGIIVSIEQFFRSAWYQELTGVDGTYLLRKLREEVRS